jgi:Flp pilus assembly protein TadD
MNIGLKEKVLALCGEERFGEADTLIRETFAHTEDDTERIDLLLLLSDVRDRAGFFDEACKALFSAIEIDRNCVKAWNNLGVLCRREDKPDAAREAFLQAALIDPENADVLTNLGSVSLKLSDPVNAKLHLEHALSLAPDNPIAHANLALTLATFGRIEDAEEELRLAVLYGFSNPEPIMDKLDRMKEIRARIQSQQQTAVSSEPDPE